MSKKLDLRISTRVTVISGYVGSFWYAYVSNKYVFTQYSRILKNKKGLKGSPGIPFFSVNMEVKHATNLRRHWFKTRSGA